VRITDLTVRAAKRGAVVVLAAGAVVGGTATAAMADQNGAYNTGEFVLYQLGSYGGGVYDTAQQQIPSYPAINAKYVNSPTTINDSPDSSKNGKSVRIYLFEASFCEGSKVTHLALQEPDNGVASWAYTSLGWLNNKASGHSNNLTC
jgi:hypothetical protein